MSLNRRVLWRLFHSQKDDEGMNCLWSTDRLPAARWLLMCIAATVSPLLAQEVCGLQSASTDILFMDVFDPLKAGLGLALSTVAAPELGVKPTVRVTFPPSNAVLTSPRVQVAGKFTGPSGTGISVNGIRAYIHNGTFVTPSFQLRDGTTPITATVTTIDGLTASDTKSVTYGAGTTELTLTVDSTAGFTPLSIGVALSLTPGVVAQAVIVDFGDGSAPFSGTDLRVIPRHSYANAGVYALQATVLDTQKNNYQASYRIAVVDIKRHRETLCSVYAHLRSRMAAGDAAGALNAYHLSQRPKYEKLFMALGSQLPLAAGRLGTIADGLIGLDQAELTLVVEKDAQLSGYPLQLSPDALGVWRINAM